MQLATLLKIFGLVLLAHLCNCALINVSECNKATERNISTVSRFDVTPCDDAPDGACKFVRGNPANLTIVFTSPQNCTRRMRNGLYWQNGITDLPFAGMNPRACPNNLPCDCQQGDQVTFAVQLPIRRNLPTGTYDTKIKIYSGATLYLCKVFRVKLV